MGRILLRMWLFILDVTDSAQLIGNLIKWGGGGAVVVWIERASPFYATLSPLVQVLVLVVAFLATFVFIRLILGLIRATVKRVNGRMLTAAWQNDHIKDILTTLEKMEDELKNVQHKTERRWWSKTKVNRILTWRNFLVFSFIFSWSQSRGREWLTCLLDSNGVGYKSYVTPRYNELEKQLRSQIHLDPVDCRNATLGVVRFTYEMYSVLLYFKKLGMTTSNPILRYLVLRMENAREIYGMGNFYVNLAIRLQRGGAAR